MIGGVFVMMELQNLLSQRDTLLEKIRSIEATCEGLENENNAKRVQELNLVQAQLTAEKNEIQSKLNVVQLKLTAINEEIAQLGGTGVERIIEAIKNQRWYFFKNNTKILLDRNTGLLWANLEYFPYRNNRDNYSLNDACNAIENYKDDIITTWRLPTFNEMKEMIYDRSFPFQENENWRIKNRAFWHCNMQGLSGDGIDLNDLNTEEGVYDVIPCTSHLVDNTDYKNNVSPSNPVYTEQERFQFTLDLFVQNNFEPIFDEPQITELYKKVYFEKPVLLQELQDIQSQIDSLQTVELLSSSFDYTALLVKYDTKSIDTSIIKYYQAVQTWCDELIDKVEHYEEVMDTVIRDFNVISLKLSKKYEENPHLTEEENRLLSDRQRYFQKRFSLGMHSVKSKILAVKEQADELEYRIDDIDNGDDAMHALAILEKEERASFGFIAENTAKIIRNALLKVEYFQDNHAFVMHAINVWEDWSEGYRVFKTTYREDLKHGCEDDGIEEDIWGQWYEDWQKIRYAIEQKVQPIIERGLKSNIPTLTETNVSVPEQLIEVLETYKNNVDRFFLEDRKGIYQKFAFQAGGDLQDKFESQSELYKCTSSLQSALQEIIFNCANAEDRVFILKWANSLLDIQIDEILTFVADNELQNISNTILTEFATLKQKNFDAYLTDAKAYGEEKARREKEYTSLIFKMRKDLMK